MNVIICPNIIRNASNENNNSYKFIVRLLSCTDTFKICFDNNWFLLDEYKNSLGMSRWDPVILEYFLSKIQEWIIENNDHISILNINLWDYDDYCDLVVKIWNNSTWKNIVVNDLNDYLNVNIAWLNMKEVGTLLDEMRNRTIMNFNGIVWWVQANPQNSTQNNI